MTLVVLDRFMIHPSLNDPSFFFFRFSSFR